MTIRWKRAGVAVAALLAAGLAACAPQQQSTPAAAAPAPSAATAQGSGAAPMDHQAMMAHCAEMRQQMSRGVPVSADMQRMATYCQHMDHAMGSGAGRSTRP